MVEANCLMQVVTGLSRKYLSNARRLFFPSLQIKPCGVRYKSGKNLFSQNGNIAVHLLRSSLIRIVSIFVFFGDEGVITTGTGLNVLVFCDVDYSLCWVLVAYNMFELGE